MQPIDLKKQNQRWQEYHILERQLEISHSKNITGRYGYIVLQNLYDFAYRINPKNNFNDMNLAKINNLIKIRSILKKVAI